MPPAWAELREYRTRQWLEVTSADVPSLWPQALAEAGIPPEAVGHVNAHATGTRRGDVAETRAIRAVFGAHADRLAVSAAKSMTGHLLGAAGAVEAVYSVLALEHQVVPPTINLDQPDPECDLDCAGRPRSTSLAVALSNSFGFGGTTASLIFGRDGRHR